MKRRFTRFSDIVGPDAAQQFAAEHRWQLQTAAALRTRGTMGRAAQVLAEAMEKPGAPGQLSEPQVKVEER